jgi:hypothetical protein
MDIFVEFSNRGSFKHVTVAMKIPLLLVILLKIRFLQGGGERMCPKLSWMVCPLASVELVIVIYVSITIL